MISDSVVDQALLSHVTKEWRKMAFVIGVTMMQLDPNERDGLNDEYFAKRIILLAEAAIIDSSGDLSQMRQCEVRLSSACE